MNPKELEFFRSLQKTLQGGAVQPEEFAQVIKVLVKVIKDTRESLERAVADSKGELSRGLANAIKDIKTSETHISGLLRDTKRITDRDIVTLTKQFQEEVQRVKNLIPTLPDFAEIKEDLQNEINTIRALIPEVPEHPSPESHREALEGLLDMDAINGLLEEFKKVREEIIRNTRRGGGHTDMVIKYTIGRIVKTEAPSGLINGSNKDYTVDQPIHAVLGFMLNGEAIALSNYTIAGNKLTFSTALPAAYSGKDFEMIYI